MRRLILILAFLLAAAPALGQGLTVKADSFVAADKIRVKFGTATAGDILDASTAFGTYIKGAADLGIHFQPTHDIDSWIIGPGGTFYPAATWTTAIGADTFRVKTIYASELNVWKLAARTVVASVGGEIWTAPTTTLSADASAGATSITVVDNFLASGDRLLLKSLTNVEWLAVTSGASGSAGAYVYSVTRDLDGTGANTWAKGTAVVDTGTAGAGIITQYAEGSALPSALGTTTLAGPTVLGAVRTGTTWNAVSPRWAVGRLTGLYDYGTGTTYGLAAGDASGTWFSIDATNGFRIKYGSTTKVAIDASGNASFTGAVTATSGTFTGTVQAGAGYFGSSSAGVSIDSSGLDVGTSGRIQGGASAFGTGTGFWLGYDSSAYKFRVGTASGQRMTWDGDLWIFGAHWSLTPPTGLSFGNASVGSSAYAVNWDSGAQIGSDSGVMWLWGAGGNSAGKILLYGDKVDIGVDGYQLFRADNLAVTTFRDLIPDSDVTRTLGSGSLYYERAYVNHVDAAYDTSSSVTAYIFQDLTPWPEGVDAVAELLKVKGDGTGHIDHASLPASTRRSVVRKQYAQPQGPGLSPAEMHPVEIGAETVPTRDLGATISLLTIAIQQQQAQIDALRKQLEALKK